MCISAAYLFTADGSTRSSLKEHVIDKQKHLNKLVIFLEKNRDMPFVVKRKVVEACFNAAILYGCESWLDTDLQPIERLYNAAIKHLLGVRVTIPIDLCLSELGFIPLKALVRHRQQIFFNKIFGEMRDKDEDPLAYALELTRTRNVKLFNYISGVAQNCSYISAARQALHARISASDRTRYQTYLSLNPGLTVHQVYERQRGTDYYIPEHLRMSFTRMRLSSHRLRIETGRWARISRAQRLCQCGAVQDEAHVLLSCPVTFHLRQTLGRIVTFPDVLTNARTVTDFIYIHDVLSLFTRFSN